MSGIGIVRVPSGMITRTRRPSDRQPLEPLARNAADLLLGQVAIDAALPRQRSRFSPHLVRRKPAPPVQTVRLKPTTGPEPDATGNADPPMMPIIRSPTPRATRIEFSY